MIAGQRTADSAEAHQRETCRKDCDAGQSN